MTASAGVCNDWFTTDPTWDESGTTVAARLTGLAWTSESGRRLLHLAGAFRRNGADDEQIRLKGRPSRTSPTTTSTPATYRPRTRTSTASRRCGTKDRWWANRRIRISAGYGRAALARAGATGHTSQYFTRVQWVY